MRTVTTTYYSFSELTQEQQKALIDRYPEKFQPDNFWHDPITDDIVSGLELIGFDCVKVGFSGFWSQGDGAHFTGRYGYQKGAIKKVKAEFPKWEELHALAKALQEAEKACFYQVGFTIKHRGHYSHENCTSFDFTDDRDNHGFFNGDESAFIEPCREFMRHIYHSLEKEYYYFSSEEYILDNADCFEWLEFTEGQVNNA